MMKTTKKIINGWEFLSFPSHRGNVKRQDRHNQKRKENKRRKNEKESGKIDYSTGEDDNTFLF